jgi:hypothetical protein
MFSHRFAEHLEEKQASTQIQSGCAFVPVPFGTEVVDWRMWVYLAAFQEAQYDALAERRARMLEASRN